MHRRRTVERTRARCRHAVLVAFASLPLPNSSFAANRPEPVTLVTGPDYAPYTVSEAAGGLAVEVVGRALAAVTQPYTVSWRPWNRAYAEARLGMYGAAFPYSYSPERAALFHYSAPLVILQIQLFTRPGSTLNTASLSSFAGKRVCTPAGWATAVPVAAMVEAGTIKEERPPTLANCAAMVALGRADFFIAEQRIGSAAAASAGPGAIVAAGRYPSSALYLIAPRSLAGSADFIVAFNRGLARIQRSGEYARILARYDVAPPLSAPH